MKNYDLVIVGTGVVGLGAAIAAKKLKPKIKILLIDRHQQCTGASIRNFGFITITGLELGIMQKRALRSKEIWLDMCKIAKIPIHHRGLYFLAHHLETLPVLENYLEADQRSNLKLLSLSELEKQNQFLSQTKPHAALYSPDELRIEPRIAIPKITNYLSKIKGIDFLWNQDVIEDLGNALKTPKKTISYDKLFLATGNHLQGLGRDLFLKHKVQNCRLHMLKIKPDQSFKLGGGVMSDLTLMRYPGYQNLNFINAAHRMLKKNYKKEIQNGIHLIAVQCADGSLIIGDSHHYTDHEHLPFESEIIDQQILSLMEKVLGIKNYTVTERWIGHYPSGKDDYFQHFYDRDRVQAVVTTGIGMSTGFAFAEETIERLLN